MNFKGLKSHITAQYVSISFCHKLIFYSTYDFNHFFNIFYTPKYRESLKLHPKAEPLVKALIDFHLLNFISFSKICRKTFWFYLCKFSFVLISIVVVQQ